MTIAVHLADCVAWLAAHEGPLFDACVTDPPYHLTSIVKRFGTQGAAPAKTKQTGAYARASRGFMGKQWDGGDVAFRPETWRAVFDRLKPGAHLIAFSGTRTYHRMACAIEDAGFEIRDQLAWAYGSGFPKSHDVAKGIDKAAGAERAVVGRKRSGVARVSRLGGEPVGGHSNEAAKQVDVTAPATPEAAAWEGWGTALKPSWEPICLARKPISEASVAANVLRWGTGALNIDGCRIDGGQGGERSGEASAVRRYSDNGSTNFAALPGPRGGDAKGRWPANLCHDGSDDVARIFPDTESGSRAAGEYGGMGYSGADTWQTPARDGSVGTAARFFYSAKAGPLDRLGSAHATVKPIDLMRWLVRMVTPPGGMILEPFAGSGTTGVAAMSEGFGCTMLDIEAEHVADIERKLALLRGEAAGIIAHHIKRRVVVTPPEDLPLFREGGA